MKISELTKGQFTEDIVDKVLYEGIEYKQQSLDVAIVLGSSKAHIYRLPYVVEVYKNGLVSKIIVSGGRNIGNANVVEADYLKEKAIEFGIKKKDILVENKAMTTWKNMKLSRELMIKNNLLGECTNIAIVTSSFHMRRSIMIAERVLRDMKNATGDEIRQDMDTYLKYARVAYIQMLKDVLPASDYVIDGTKELDEKVDEIKKIILSL